MFYLQYAILCVYELMRKQCVIDTTPCLCFQCVGTTYTVAGYML